MHHHYASGMWPYLFKPSFQLVKLTAINYTVRYPLKRSNGVETNNERRRKGQCRLEVSIDIPLVEDIRGCEALNYPIERQVMITWDTKHGPTREPIQERSSRYVLLLFGTLGKIPADGNDICWMVMGQADQGLGCFGIKGQPCVKVGQVENDGFSFATALHCPHLLLWLSTAFSHCFHHNVDKSVDNFTGYLALLNTC